jgi:excisionase family DNA binding protein
VAAEVRELEVSIEEEPITVAADQQDGLKQIEEILLKANLTKGVQHHPVRLDLDGKMVELPEPILRLLRQIVPRLLKGHAVRLVPLRNELTTQEAADILGVSRPFLIGLLERGEIPYVKTGKHRRIGFADLMTYKRRRDATRREALDRLTELAQEYGLDRYQD